ncbi:hypothetical protein CC80DRAFT_505946 [Byssothecium circinans]|uniref:Uncharacterized protein n=1 Tax=Byssothecium circinans TaxID=147558 RepID=A0A6A5TR79_9PLEO|nr:hypothetical protein CC80DRAFT_505946 [Byssothecium circinans]
MTYARSWRDISEDLAENYSELSSFNLMYYRDLYVDASKVQSYEVVPQSRSGSGTDDLRLVEDEVGLQDLVAKLGRENARIEAIRQPTSRLFRGGHVPGSDTDSHYLFKPLEEKDGGTVYSQGNVFADEPLPQVIEDLLLYANIDNLLGVKAALKIPKTGGWFSMSYPKLAAGF